MGVNNRQRRAEKARKRAKQRARSTPPRWHGDDGAPLFTPQEQVAMLLASLVRGEQRDERREHATLIAALGRHDPGIVHRQLEASLRRTVAMLWDNGWQPAEVVRQVRRQDARAGRLAGVAVAADHLGRDPQRLHPAWRDQLVELPAADGATGWLASFGRDEGLDGPTLLVTATTALLALSVVGPLTVLIPPPGGAVTASAVPDQGVQDPVLVKIRALLAQAESTTFDGEAEAFTAKAQELIAKHAIDTAMLWARSTRDERPTAVRLPIDDPYADIKSLLLQHVARHTRCQAVFHPRYALSTVVGFASDVAAVELLFTSLLVQSQAALRTEAAKSGPGGHRRSRSFRASFLIAFTARIDHRLAAINRLVESAAGDEHGGGLLPVLASREDAVDERVRELFGELQAGAIRGGGSSAGWASGTQAADLAQLSFGDLDDAVDDEGWAPQLPLGAA